MFRSSPHGTLPRTNSTASRASSLVIPRRATSVQFAALVLLGLLAAAAPAADWNAFRGPVGNGKTAAARIPSRWDAEHTAWKVALPQPGNGSPIVVGERVLVTCAEDPAGKQRSLYCFDLGTGKQQWVQTVTYDQVAPTHKTNPYCGSTPASDGRTVVVWHGSAGLYAYDLEGKLKWKQELGVFHHTWGYGGSPVIYRDRVLMQLTPGAKNYMAALALDTGKVLWKVEEPHAGDGNTNEDGKYMGSWSTPVIAEVEERTVAVTTMPTRVVGYDVGTGEVVWYCDGIRGPRGDLAYSSPLLAGGFCMATGGYQGPSIGFQMGGSGDITDTQRRWRMEKNPQSIGSGVVVGQYAYIPYAGPGVIKCIEIASGKEQWVQRTGSAWSSAVMAGEILFVIDQDGNTVAFKANPKQFELVAKSQLGDSTNATPALVDGHVVIRGNKFLHCLQD